MCRADRQLNWNKRFKKAICSSTKAAAFIRARCRALVVIQRLNAAKCKNENFRLLMIIKNDLILMDSDTKTTKCPHCGNVVAVY
jgi:hypothetical protein